MQQPSVLDDSFMRRALRLAMHGRGQVEPNPMVGCVLVKDGRIIGEGFHAKYGGPHAEPGALANCAESPQGATAYVTLEPCCHTNKKTPPCAPRLIEAKVKRVVIGCLDPNSEVNGKGVAMLRAAGIEVDGPVLEGEAKQLIAPFILRTTVGRPYVTLKWAETADGKVAGPAGRRQPISSPLSHVLVHQLRSRCDAILIGSRTALLDDPLLTARGVPMHRPLIRAVLDTELRIQVSSTLVQTARDHPTVVYCADEVFQDSPNKAEPLREAGVEVVPVAETLFLVLDDVLAHLLRRGVTHLLVEPGPILARSMMDQNVADRIWRFRARARIEHKSAPSACVIPAEYLTAGEFEVGFAGGDLLTEYLNPSSAAFYACIPSADLVLAQETAHAPPR